MGINNGGGGGGLPPNLQPEPHIFNFTVNGNVGLASEAPLAPAFVNARGRDVALVGVHHVCVSGTVTFDVHRNGVALPAYSGITVDSGATVSELGEIVLADGDLLVPVVTATDVGYVASIGLIIAAAFPE